jgi:putative PIN family toxin of toxin-antitoxin system
VNGARRAVLDANVLVSAFLLPRGTPGKLVERIWAEPPPFRLVLSAEICAEVGEVLDRPKIRRRVKGSGVDPQTWFRSLVVLSDVVETPDVPKVSRDPEDDKYLAAALHGSAEHLVTGDQDLLTLDGYEGVRILKPAEFLGLLSRGER